MALGIKFKKKVITGCEARGDADSPYLTRYTLFDASFGAVYLHIFHRSDADEHHDHPWPFISIILWRGYREETPGGKKRVRPGMILFRPATWRHRVELVDGKRAVSLVVRGKYTREWGFFTKTGWQDWVSYFKERGC